MYDEKEENELQEQERIIYDTGLKMILYWMMYMRMDM